MSDEDRQLGGDGQPPQGGLGILFLAAAVALAVLLGGIGVVAYLFMKR